MALRMGMERARLWRRQHNSLPFNADAATVTDYAFGSDAADSLGLKDEKLKEQIRGAAARFTARDFLQFDPLSEPPPTDVPDDCEYDDATNPRGSKLCRVCERPLHMLTRYDVWYDALITVYVAGLSNHAWRGEALSFPSVRPLLEQFSRKD